MRRIPLLLAALVALPISLYTAPGAAQATLSAAASAAAIGAMTTTTPASQRTRAIEQFTAGWRFLQADAAGAEKPAFDDSAWKSVTLPHDWSIAGPVKEDAPSRGAGGFAPTGIGWYRKTFTVPSADAKPAAARRTFIVFDGVMANSDVYLNGELLGHRPYGYVSFVYELTPHLRAGKNVIAVKVDDSQQPASRWYPGAGINRQVRLVTTGDAHIVPWGTFVTTPAVMADSATIHIRSTVTNESAAAAKLSLRVQLTAPNGSVLKTTKPIASEAADLAPGATADLNAETTISNPDRWDIGHGAMYTVHATLLRDGKAVDEESVPFGIREFHFDADQGFFLNGVHHKVNGVAIHTDGGAVGTAVPLAVWERRLTELRKLGVNAIRTAHNPPAPEFLDLADRMGFLIMDEMFDCWTVAKNPYDYHLYFKEWNIRDTTDTVLRDRNHPSIILWSAGNEIHDTPRPEVAIPILKALVATFHQNDPTRPVTQALFRPNTSHDYEDGLADLLDVVGQNYRPQEILAAHAQKPTRSIIGTENGHDRDQWIAVRDHAEYSGQFLWSGIDYLGESRTWPTIGSGSGLLNTVALPHGRAFERESWWATTPMVAMVRRTAVVRPASVDPGYANATSTDQSAATATPRATASRPAGARPAGAATPPAEAAPRFSEPLLADWTPKDLGPHTENVEVYTNAEEVELFLNGKSLGTEKQHPDASPIVYQVPFEPGTLKAVARSGGTIVATDELKTAGKPARIVFTADKPTTPLTPDWNDVRTVTATLVDEAGTRIPDSTMVVKFAATGPASIIAVDNGNLTDHDPYQASECKLYFGNALALLRATGAAGKVTVTASADGVPTASLTLTTAPIDKEDPAIAKTSATKRGF
jgi:beta-galactosidase